ncbi:hypothetical protein CYLTODRAFT_423912, partial [Cylindrobasidium torrendii FP15055 ss-10]
MGVAGLWPVLEESARVQSITALALSKFDTENKGFRLGIDASIWFFHAEYGKEGENPELRTLFFRCGQFLNSSILPLFIFDGPKRPEFKRGKKINRSANKLTTGMKKIIEAYGFQHHTAPGEAEAELAYLNEIGVIDGVLTDDVDTYLFGAHTIVRNPSSTHSKAKNTFKKSFVRVYTDVEYSRADLILVGLCSGGDYHAAGLESCGIKTSLGLAKAGFGEELFEAARSMSGSKLTAFLDDWRARVVKELATNASGHIGQKKVSLSKKVPKSFPNVDVLMSYVFPITSFSEGRPDFYDPIMRSWTVKEPSLPDLANTCEFYFEWGFKESIVKRARTLFWPGIAFRVLRRYLLEGEGDGQRVQAVFADGKPMPKQDKFMRLIHSTRSHETTDQTLEYRVEIDPRVLVKLVEAGVQGMRRADDHEWEDESDEEARKESKVDPETPLRVWLPASLVRKACPEITEAWDAKNRKKAEAEKKKEERKAKAAEKKSQSQSQSQVSELSGDDDLPIPKKAAKPPKSKKTVGAYISGEEEERPVSKLKPIPKARNKTIQLSDLSAEDELPVSKKPAKPKPQPGDVRNFYKTSKTGKSAKAAGKAPARPTTPQRTPSQVIDLLDAFDTPISRPATASVTASQRAPQPFPLQFSHSPVQRDSSDAEDSEVEVYPPPPPPLTPSPKKKSRRSVSAASSSESDVDRITKSPRRSRMEASPKASKVRRDTSPLTGRVSTPLRKKQASVATAQATAAKKSQEETIIIISSDEDESAPPPKPKPQPNLKPKPRLKLLDDLDSIPPLLRAQARMKK